MSQPLTNLRLLLRLLAVLGLAAASLVLFGAPAQACSCAMQGKAALVSGADQVFTGTVVDATRTGSGSVGDIVYDVEVDRSFKGDVAGTVQVATAASSASCGLEGIPLGSDYVFFTQADAKGTDVVSASLCGGSAPLTKGLVRKVEAVAGPGSTPSTGSDDTAGDAADDTADDTAGEPAEESETEEAETEEAETEETSAEGSGDDGVPVLPFIGGVLVIALAAGTWAARRTT